MTVETPQIKDQLLDAALLHVPFDGWSEASFRAAIADIGADPAVARAACPRGATDLAVAFHQRGDSALKGAVQRADLGALRIRDRVARAVRLRLELAGDREVVRRGIALFSLPHLAPEGARLTWNTADAIWSALGDPSDDINWYTKRAILSGVYSSTVLYWLGDNSPESEATWAFLDRRIDDVMQFERVKAAANRNALFKTLFAGPLWLAGKVRAPSDAVQDNMPGRWAPPPQGSATEPGA
ncbi:COQ9 family protein [Rhodobacteraceae bacterium 2376]|uniref:COQ9 family protein n=1 Tax=Rhabdonatronobacter sediminivivens TaxID=2743469 RepID=A0A7Z0KXE1_9RHOB|nr:COQ9 family protein [Rhabdonatronobacter sediminivivens]NYS24787.1 COQ9 family protein [Rhabdonatronobacter sediminivivens]